MHETAMWMLASHPPIPVHYHNEASLHQAKPVSFLYTLRTSVLYEKPPMSPAKALFLNPAPHIGLTAYWYPGCAALSAFGWSVRDDTSLSAAERQFPADSQNLLHTLSFEPQTVLNIISYPKYENVLEWMYLIQGEIA